MGIEIIIEGKTKRMSDIDIYEKSRNLMSYYYKRGDRIFFSVLRKNFSESAEHIGDYLVSEGYVRKDTLYRCPNCNLFICIGKPEIFEGEIICCNCDNSYDITKLIKEPVWIRI